LLNHGDADFWGSRKASAQGAVRVLSGLRIVVLTRMPLKLIPPRGKSPNWFVRGTHLHTRVNQSCLTPDKKLASKMLGKIKAEIENDLFEKPRRPTFAAAAIRYIEAGGERRFIMKLAEYFGAMPLDKIGQAEVDAAAVALYPAATNATRNRQCYSPVSAVLKHAGRAEPLKRPKGARDERRLSWLQPQQVSRLVAAAAARDLEFGLFIGFLIYSGARLSEALAIECTNINLSEAWAYLPSTKNSEPRLIHLPHVLIAALANHPRGLNRSGKLFRFGKNGRLYTWLADSARAADVDIPEGISFHIFRHSWAAWMRRYGGLDTSGLLATRAWRDRSAASVYEHAIQSEEARRADLLPNVIGEISLLRSRQKQNDKQNQ
jgi:integrase